MTKFDNYCPGEISVQGWAARCREDTRYPRDTREVERLRWTSTSLLEMM
jgi:hypothetical protein